MHKSLNLRFIPVFVLILLGACNSTKQAASGGGAPSPSPTAAPVTPSSPVPQPSVVPSIAPSPSAVLVSGTVSFTTESSVQNSDCIRIATIAPGGAVDPATVQDLGCSKGGSQTTKPVQLTFYPGQCTQIVLFLVSSGKNFSDAWDNLSTADKFGRRIHKDGGWPHITNRSMIEFWSNDNDDKKATDFYIKIEIPDPSVKYVVPNLVNFCN